eukprot:m.3642 g.3642  ORF g.3642 m.3642 type:complete len:119 (+) comp9656_c0_seq1:183-539(+)
MPLLAIGQLSKQVPVREMEGHESNLSALQNRKEVQDGCFVFQIKKVEDLDGEARKWFGSKCANDKLVLQIHVKIEDIPHPAVLKTLPIDPIDVRKLPPLSGIKSKLERSLISKHHSIN